jgi:hypothetical protein
MIGQLGELGVLGALAAYKPFFLDGTPVRGLRRLGGGGSTANAALPCSTQPASAGRQSGIPRRRQAPVSGSMWGQP